MSAVYVKRLIKFERGRYIEGGGWLRGLNSIMGE
jgi:hypothetical protein